MAADFEIPGLGRSGDRPQPDRRIDVRGLKLTTVEGFVLSRVDGTASFAEICAVTGLGHEATLEILRRLRAQGLFTIPGTGASATARPTPSRVPEAPRVASPGAPPAPATPPPAAPVRAASLLARLDDGSAVDPQLLAGAPLLPEETRVRLVRVHRRLASLTPHELLGVAANADAASVKRAYFAASKELHPDRFYGKELGPFRERIGEIFKACASAFEKLGNR